MENYIKTIDNGILPRFGHTITLVSKKKAIMFGGAIESNGKFSLSGDVYVYYVDTMQWNLIDYKSIKPCPRAAHAACCIALNQMVIYGGGIDTGNYASDDLYLFDLHSEEHKSEWIIIPISQGPTPGQRYGHSLTFNKPHIMLFGGSYLKEIYNDLWIMNCQLSVIEWKKIEFPDLSPIPSARLYHSANMSNEEMIVFGGRDNSGKALNDLWHLHRVSLKSYEWKKIDYDKNVMPKARHQHSSIVFSDLLVNIGGRSEKDGDNVPIEVFNYEGMTWTKLITIKRFRHASFFIDNLLYMYGGLEQDKKNTAVKEMHMIDLFNITKDNTEAKEIESKIKEYVEKNLSALKPPSPNKESPSPSPSHSPRSKDGAFNFILSNHAQIGNHANPKEEIGGLVHLCSIDSLNNKSDKLMKMYKNKVLSSDAELHDKVIMALLRPKEWINSKSLHQLDNDMNNPSSSSFKEPFEMPSDVILYLINSCLQICKEQPIVLKVEAPVKIFGDIHGQYQDLMRFFDLYSAPIQGPGGDIDGLDYIFLGDYVDRGTHSLETMCLLMALKIKFPDQIHLLRGNHEDRGVNNSFGFKEECMERLKDDEYDFAVFNRFNDFFDYLPLVAIVNETVLCIHGGIGSKITTLGDIEQIKRPLEVVHEVHTLEQQFVVDVLWSDPTDSDEETGIQPNDTRDPNGIGNIVKFGPDRVEEFLKVNNLTLILRAHECVMDGFERFAKGKLITVFSATDYCGTHQNAGAVIFLTKNFDIKPYLIYPQKSIANAKQNWDCNEEMMKLRPPTPPRNRQGSSNGSSKSQSKKKVGRNEDEFERINDFNNDGDDDGFKPKRKGSF